MNVIPVAIVNKISKKAIKEALGKERVEFIDWDKFFYIHPKKGRPVQDPEWPANFIRAIRCLVYETKGLKAYNDLRYVFISAGPKPLSYLVDDKIPFVITMPRSLEPDEHWQFLNEKYLKLNMPMVYMNDDELIDIFKKDSTYKYFIDKIDFVEAYRFGTCVYAEDLEEFDEVFGHLYDKHNSIEGSADADSGTTTDGSIMNLTALSKLEGMDPDIILPTYRVENKSGQTVANIDGIVNCLNTTEEFFKDDKDEEYTIFTEDGNAICTVCFKDDKGIILKMHEDKTIQW